jgi:CRISPR-associated endonuclease/helicase Cas3
VLEHHASLTPEQQTWREKMLCENWDSPVVYTTMVQFLESLFGSGTRGARRMHQLANAVLIFDEIQTLPVKCVHLFNNAINLLVEQCNSTVVLCTATQPLLHEVAPEKGVIRLSDEHEIMPNRGELFDRLKRVEVRDERKPNGWSFAEVANLALQEVSRTGSCLAIVNTKSAAREVFKACRRQWSDGVIVHLSTDMCPSHRKNELERVTQHLDSTPVLCVSTQLIEAGVDVDFRTVIRFVAGLDSIAQAAGRCNRNGRPEPGTVHIVNPSEDDLGMLPDIAFGRDVANRLLDDFGEQPDRYRQNLFGIEALDDYYRYYFFQRQQEMSYPLSAKSIGKDDTLVNMLSGNTATVSEYQRNGHAAPERLLNQSFMSASRAFKAIDASTQGVIVPYGENGRSLVAELYAAYDIELAIELLRKAQQYTVNVFPHVLKKLEQTGALNEIKPETRIFSLDSRFYSRDFGLATEPAALMETLYVGT